MLEFASYLPSDVSKQKSFVQISSGQKFNGKKLRGKIGTIVKHTEGSDGIKQVLVNLSGRKIWCPETIISQVIPVSFRDNKNHGKYLPAIVKIDQTFSPPERCYISGICKNRFPMADFAEMISTIKKDQFCLIILSKTYWEKLDSICKDVILENKFSNILYIVITRRIMTNNISKIGEMKISYSDNQQVIFTPSLDILQYLCFNNN